MQLLFLSGSGELGGAERSLLDIMASLRHARPAWGLRLIAPADGALLREAASLDVQAEVLPFGSTLERIGDAGGAQLATRLTGAVGSLAVYGRRLRARIRATAPDIIHTHGLKVHLMGAWANPGPAGVVWHLHDYVGRRPASAALLRRSLGRCRFIVANSSSVADDARATLGTGVPTVPMLNGIDLERCTPLGPTLDLDAEAGAAPTSAGTVRVGLLATFGRWKGHATFIDACARLPRALPIHAYIIGGPLYRTEGSQYSLEELRVCADQAGVADRVTFTGFVARPEQALRALDIVVHASTEPEPFGLVIAEAMACGRAVIAADAGGARELVRPGIDALTHVPGDSASLAEGIVALATDVGLRNRLAVQARETAARRFDRARLATDLAPVYERSLAQRACA